MMQAAASWVLSQPWDEVVFVNIVESEWYSFLQEVKSDC